jgi:hypothetical protein
MVPCLIVLAVPQHKPFEVLPLSVSCVGRGAVLPCAEGFAETSEPCWCLQHNSQLVHYCDGVVWVWLSSSVPSHCTSTTVSCFLTCHRPRVACVFSCTEASCSDASHTVPHLSEHCLMFSAQSSGCINEASSNCRYTASSATTSLYKRVRSWELLLLHGQSSSKRGGLERKRRGTYHEQDSRLTMLKHCPVLGSAPCFRVCCDQGCSLPEQLLCFW